MDKRAMADAAVAQFGRMLTVEGLKLGTDDHSCTLVFDGDLLLNIEYDEGAEQLVFSMLLDELPREHAEPLLRDMLAANLYGQGTRGATLCLDESAGTVMLFSGSSVLELDQGRFERIVENLLDQAEHWRGQIARHREQAPPEAAVPAPMPHGMPMIFG